MTAANGGGHAPEDDSPRLIQARRGFSLSYQGKTLLSRVDPQAQADRIALAAPKHERALYFCPSPLLGYGLQRLLEGLAADSAVLCVEADQRLMALSQEAMANLLRDHPRLALVRTDDPASLCAYVRKRWGSRRFRRLETLRLSGGWQLAGDCYQALAGALRREIALDWGNAMTLVKLGRRYLYNALRNLRLICRTPRLETLNFGASPVLLLGAGPSLDGMLDGLVRRFGDLSLPASDRRGAAGSFRIICVDTALPALRARNIRPDLAVALESQHWNLRDFIGLGDWEVPLAMDLSALPATAGMLGGRPLLFFTPWTRLDIWDRLEAAGLLPERFPALGSVGLSAATLARRLSSGPIVIGGIDFSFTLDSFHARSTPSRLELLRRQDRFHSLINAGAAFRPGSFPARSKTGLRVRSDPALRGYRDLFEEYFGGDSRFWDIAGQGLPLGAQTAAMERAFDVLESPCQDQGAVCAVEYPAPDAAQGALRAFIQQEREALITLRGILQGEIAVPLQDLERALDRAGYLW
ncbi:MAG: DUF115 domain-containing protein, partial [Treponema sp.]|nr:DUF115 domain-containing protein [Treponema sp.]